MLIKLYDGRSIDVPTDYVDKAKLVAARWAKENPVATGFSFAHLAATSLALST